MKIMSINFINSEDVPKVAPRNTANQANLNAILENLAKAGAGKSLVITGEDIKKFERYQLQKALQKRGAKVLVNSGTHPTTGKPVLFVRRLTDKEWADWMKA